MFPLVNAGDQSHFAVTLGPPVGDERLVLGHDRGQPMNGGVGSRRSCNVSGAFILRLSIKVIPGDTSSDTTPTATPTPPTSTLNLLPPSTELTCKDFARSLTSSSLLKWMCEFPNVTKSRERNQRQLSADQQPPPTPPSLLPPPTPPPRSPYRQQANRLMCRSLAMASPLHYG